MIVYMVITVYAGCVDEVRGFIHPMQAEAYLDTKRRELGIEPGEEGESEHDVQLHEVDIDAYPTSVAIRQLTW